MDRHTFIVQRRGREAAARALARLALCLPLLAGWL